jgi:hypothetical protein
MMCTNVNYSKYVQSDTKLRMLFRNYRLYLSSLEKGEEPWINVPMCMQRKTQNLSQLL